MKTLNQIGEIALNTNEFTYYSFYQQIRSQVTPLWGTKIRNRIEDLAKSGSELSDAEEKTTRLLVTLKVNGQILRVQIIANSGFREFDEAAVEAFRAAAPFVDPPKGMVDGDGNIKIRWNFVIEN